MLLAPTRELTLQTHKVVKELGRHTNLRTAVLVGGDSMEAQFAELAANPDIIVATPGGAPRGTSSTPPGQHVEAVISCRAGRPTRTSLWRSRCGIRSELSCEAAQVNALGRAGTQIQHHCGQSKGCLVATQTGPCSRLGNPWLHARAIAGSHLWLYWCSLRCSTATGMLVGPTNVGCMLRITLGC